MTVSNLIEEVGIRADRDASLSEEAKLVIWAALEGEGALADLDSYVRPEFPDRMGETEAVEPAGAYIRQVSVQGFRGIGAETTLKLKPGPGLTVVAGRNGSGKSSLAEALELAITGQTYRFKKKSAQWKDVWRNIHQPSTPRIGVDLAEEGEKSTRIELSWAEGADLEDIHATVQRHGKPRVDGLTSLGWEGPAQTYRPLLTYDELGSLLTSERSRLYDALATVLGMEELAAVIKRLEAYVKAIEESTKRAKSTKKELLGLLAELSDERAEQAVKLLKPTKPDLAALKGLATGLGSSDGASLSAKLSGLLGLAVPSEEMLLGTSTAITDAIGYLAAAGDRALEPLERRLQLANLAISIHAHEGDQTCPTCGDGRLDADRIAALREEAERADAALVELRQARARLSGAVKAGGALIAPMPGVLQEKLSDDLEPLLSVALQAWTVWADAPREPVAQANHLLTASTGLSEALAPLQKAVAAELDARDDAWAPAATKLATYVEELEASVDAKPLVDAGKAALTWLKVNDNDIKNERLAPIGDKAKEIWSDLRQESNVDITGLELKGSNTQRRVEISSAVDGRDAAGMAVLSQGELHALALALFLPRAGLPESPFRFVVLDDPVQAMDPAKVDGLLKVLTNIAQTRQVVVFSHDNRLADAVRRGGGDATIIEVTRGADSFVKVADAYDPAERYLEVAKSMANDSKLPDETKRRLLPGIFRMAVETAAHDRYFAQELANGSELTTLETTWDTTYLTSAKVALALFGAPKKLDAWLQAAGHRRRAMGTASTAFHEGLAEYNKPVNAFHDVRKMVADIRDGVLK